MSCTGRAGQAGSCGRNERAYLQRQLLPGAAVGNQRFWVSARPAGWLSSLDTDSMAATYGIRSHDARMYGELVCLSVYSLVCNCSPHLSRSARLIAEDD